MSSSLLLSLPKGRMFVWLACCDVPSVHSLVQGCNVPCRKTSWLYDHMTVVKLAP